MTTPVYPDWSTLPPAVAEQVAHQRLVETGRTAYSLPSSMPDDAIVDASLAEAVRAASTPPQVPGGSRILDLHFPSFAGPRTLGTFPPLNATIRGGTSLAAAVAQLAGGTGTQGFAKYKNVGACSLVLAAATDVSGVSWTQAIYPILDSQGNDLPTVPPMVWRCIAVMAYPALSGGIPAGADSGLLLCPSNQNNLAGTRGGVLLGPRSNNTIGFAVRAVNGGGYTVDRTFTLAACGITDLTAFNVYELRIVNATRTAGAQLKAFINGVQITPAVDCSSAAGLFPQIDVGGAGFTGYKWAVCLYQFGFAYTMYFASLHHIISSSEGDGVI